MRDPTLKFAVSVTQLERLQHLARQRKQSVAALLRHLVEKATQQEKGTDDQ
jgi:hypothetical protein